MCIVYVDNISNLIFLELKFPEFIYSHMSTSGDIRPTKLPSFEEILVTQKEPQKRSSWITGITPIRSEDIVRKVQEQEEGEEEPASTLINQPQDMGSFQQQQVYIHQPIYLPPIDEQYLSIQQPYILSLNEEGGINYYKYIINERVSVDMPYTEQTYLDNGITAFTYNSTWNFLNRLYGGSRVVFLPLRGLTLNQSKVSDVIQRYVDHQILTNAHIDFNTIQVFKLVQKVDTQIYFKRLFVLFSIIHQIDLFTQNTNGQRLNASHADICWNLGKLNPTFASFTLASLPANSIRRTIIIRYLDIKKMIMVCSYSGKTRYFQVKFVGENTYLLGNLFPDIVNDSPLNVEFLPSTEQALFTEKYPTDPISYNEFTTDTQGYLIEPVRGMERNDFPEKFKIEKKYTGKGKRMIEVTEQWYVDFNFEFYFPTTLIQYRPGPNEQFIPLMFHKQTDQPGLVEDSIVFTIENWKILENFLLTTLYPEQELLPPSQVPEQVVDQQVIDDVERPSTPDFRQPLNPLEPPKTPDFGRTMTMSFDESEEI